MAKPTSHQLDTKRYPYSITLMTRFTDVDRNGHINNIAITELLEEGHAQFVWSLKTSALDNIRSVVAHREISYLAELNYPERIDVHIGVIALGRSSWQIAKLGMRDGTPIAYAEVTLVGRDETTGAMPDAWRQRLTGMLLADT